MRRGGRVWRGLVVAALVAVGAAGCGDDPVTVVTLTVVDTVPVDFDDMVGDVPEAAEVSLDDLRDEPAYAEARPSLRCGGLDLAASFFEIEALDVGPGAIVLTYQVEVAPRGSSAWELLLQFKAAVSQGDRISLSDDRVTIGAGLMTIASVVLSELPALDVRVTGKAAGDVSDLQVAVSLAQVFSSDPKDCPR